MLLLTPLVSAAALLHGSAEESFQVLTEPCGSFVGAVHDEAEPLQLVAEGRSTCAILADGALPEVVRTACDRLADLVRARTGAAIEFLQEPDRQTVLIAPVVGRSGPLVGRLRAAGLAVGDGLGEQGFVIQRLELSGRPCIAVWSQAPIGCRYGIIELMRGLRFEGLSCATKLARVVSRPHFPLRIYYLNFAEHLQNRHSVNVLFETDEQRWTIEEWRRFIDVIAAMRYNVFEFWLVPTLFSPEALVGGPLQERFAETMCQVIEYAHSQGVLVEMIQALNTVGSDWRYYCPNTPEEREMILRLWDHWTRRLRGLDIIGLFPGDPGGCTRNGCDYRTCVDLCLDIVERTRGNGDFIYEVNTWGTPFWGWGVEGWDGGPDRAQAAFDYLTARLPDFPEQTFVGVCMGLNPDALGDAGGGSADPYLADVAALRPIATWDYGTSEGEGTVIPRFRVARIIERRMLEAARPYVGGINYTMSPALNQLQAFAAAECYWDPERSAEAIVRDYSRLAFGEENEGLGMRVFPYTEVVADWGGGGWSGGTQELAARLNEAHGALDSATAPGEVPLFLFPSPREALGNLRWHVSLLSRLAAVGADIESARVLVTALGGDASTFASAHAVLRDLPDSEDRARLAALLERIRAADLPGLRNEYWKHVYGIYDTIDRPADPRAWGATDVLFGRFGAGFVAGG